MPTISIEDSMSNRSASHIAVSCSFWLMVITANLFALSAAVLAVKVIFVG